MLNKIYGSALGLLCLAGSAFAQTDTVEWSVEQDSLLGTVGGIQMHGSAVLNVDGQRMLYAVGGNRTAGGDSVNISYAPLDLDPVNVGAWADTTFEFASDSNEFAVGSTYIERTTFAYNDRLYIVGGNHNSSPEDGLNQIRVFEPTPTGDIIAESAALGFDGAAAGVTPSLGNVGASAAVDPATNSLYVVGGSSTDTTVRRFTIDPVTGAVSDYQVMTSTLLWPSWFSSGAVVKDGYLYVIDSHNTADRGKIQYAPINGDGTLGAFVQTASLPAPQIDGGSVVMNGEIYVVGGHTGGGNTAVTNAVTRSVTGANGAITEWVADAPFPNANLSTVEGLRRIGVASLGDDGFVIIGGRNNDQFPPHVFVAEPVNASVNEWSLY